MNPPLNPTHYKGTVDLIPAHHKGTVDLIPAHHKGTVGLNPAHHKGTSFSLDLLAGYTVSGCYESSNVAAVAIAVRLKPRPP